MTITTNVLYIYNIIFQIYLQASLCVNNYVCIYNYIYIYTVCFSYISYYRNYMYIYIYDITYKSMCIHVFAIMPCKQLPSLLS